MAISGGDNNLRTKVGLRQRLLTSLVEFTKDVIEQHDRCLAGNLFNNTNF